jgi:hypothetical protein
MRELKKAGVSRFAVDIRYFVLQEDDLERIK